MKEKINYFIEKVLPFIPAVLFLLILLINIKLKIIQPMADYFSSNILEEDSRLSMILTYNAVLVGFFVTIFSLFATSNLSSLKVIIKNKLDKKFIYYFLSCIITSLIVMTNSIFIELYLINKYWIILYIFILLYSIVFSIRFIYIIISMFSYNLDSMRKEIKKQENIEMEIEKKKQQDLINKLSEDIPEN